ncbi:hypothetical protein CDL15_Pgr006763 [Punica granatum]|uniref:EF-hand domain-containing protein n=1 Tax=Punica granatum TaxID=22663 RepID=A0A218X727_PUNGR|nr:hypothetical protein CDL15_Pgr006763 [Punica granatum]PKI50648.1 hypothetical protein CRG98_028960 [Punica granatum]
MAIKNRKNKSSSPDGKQEMTMEEFKQWMYKFDSNNDGMISKEELKEAIRATGGWFARWKGDRVVRSVDSDGNGCINDDEIGGLVEFASKQFNIKIVAM